MGCCSPRIPLQAAPFTMQAPNNHTYTEDQLVALLKSRQASGFDYLYTHYSGALYGIIQQFVPDRDTAADILQEVFVNIFKRIEQFDATRSRLYTWMATIARNAAIDWVRSKGHKQQQQNRELTEAVYTTAGSTQTAVDHIGLRQMVHRLELPFKQVLDLAYFGGLTQEEISEQLGVPLGTVKTRIRTGLIKLRAMMKEKQT
ncbi:MAG TPA: sigma-70 family RNA polymerase sigma factor [Phnomibacter sp.]|nr:sigma-70 family RNA polymerase sigma factor [Phnomibacter sp.]